MKNLSYILLTLSLLLTFTSCNQKEKKIAKIIDRITEKQMADINEIIAATFDLNADSVDFGYGIRQDTLYFIDYNKFSLEDRDIDVQKKFLLAALCSESPDTKELFAQIADVPAVLQFIYVDTIGHTIYLPIDINSSELKESLSKEYTPQDVLNLYIDLTNDTKDSVTCSIEDNYFVISVFDEHTDVRLLVDSIKTATLNEDEDLFDFFNWDKIEDKMSEGFQKETKELGAEILINIYKHQPYLFRELVKANLGFEFRLLDDVTGNGFFWKCKNSDLKEIGNNK
ncbi:MAG: hypothetical protein IKO75_06990 [Bacteroidales bacterium]|nr:hypothetical protein [Bacteroidales bacterium]